MDNDYLAGRGKQKVQVRARDLLCYWTVVELGMPRIVLFSGGLDSLAGIVELIDTCSDSLWLISHKSANPSTARTQRKLFEALQSRYPTRVNHRVLKCHLHKVRVPEELCIYS